MKNFFKPLLNGLLMLAACSLAAQYDTVKDVRTGKPARYAGRFQAEPVMRVPQNPVFSKNSMRGVWVATVENIDFPVCKTPEEFKKKALEVLDNLKSVNATAVFFQIRCMNDAFYPSRLAPASRFLTGVEGRGFSGFDPLEFLVHEAHRRGMEFHAWLNPYRVAQGLSVGKSQYLKTLSQQNYARLHPEYVMDVVSNGKHYLLLNPGEPAVRSYFCEIVREIITKYRVDAIHLDDYFYPYGGTGSADSSTFAKLNPKKLSVEEWRRQNVNQLVSGIKNMIYVHNRKTKRNVRFGISPFGIWANAKTTKGGSLTGGMESRSKIYADTLVWIKNGWIDYVVPQLYWTFANDIAAYGHLTDWWVNAVKGSRTSLYIGHSVANLGGSADWKNPSEVYDQLRYNLHHSSIGGSVLYSYSKLFFPKNKIMKDGTQKVKKAWQSAR